MNVNSDFNYCKPMLSVFIGLAAGKTVGMKNLKLFFVQNLSINPGAYLS